MTREVGVGSVYVGLQGARERGNMCVCVCLCCGEIGKECLSVCVCFSVFVLYLFVNAHGDTPDLLWQGLCCSTEELC